MNLEYFKSLSIQSTEELVEAAKGGNRVLFGAAGYGTKAFYYPLRIPEDTYPSKINEFPKGWFDFITEGGKRSHHSISDYNIVPNHYNTNFLFYTEDDAKAFVEWKRADPVELERQREHEEFTKSLFNIMDWAQ